jgi:hypothetical protein
MQALVLSCALGVFCATFSAALYYFLSRTVSLPLIGITFLGPFLTVGSGIQRALRLPVEQLTPLDD